MSDQEEFFPVLSQEEFYVAIMKHAMSGEDVDEHAWAVRLATILGIVSLRHEQMSKEEIVAGLQQMAIKIPESLLDDSSAELEALNAGSL